MFGQRLDLIMHITETTNSALAMHLSLNPSYISRLRSGERKLPKNCNFLFPLSQYMASRIVTDQQKNMMERILNIGTGYPENKDLQNELIYSWLTTETDNYSVTGDFVRSFGKFEPILNNDMADTPEKTESTRVMFGTVGRTTAINEFLCLAAESEKPDNIYFYSDETNDSAIDSSLYDKKVQSALLELLNKEFRLKLVYSANVDIDQMSSRVNSFIPLVVTGNVDRYYSSHIYRSVVRHTYMILPSVCGVSITSIEGKSTECVVIISIDPDVVSKSEKVFANFLSACRPLGTKYSNPFYRTFWTSFRDFNKFQSDALIHTRNISSFTLPDVVAKIISDERDNTDFYETFLERKRTLNEFIQHNRFFEFITLPDLAEIVAGQAVFTIDDIVCGSNIYYTPAQYLTHLKELERTITNCPNFHVYLSTPLMRDFSVCIKEGYSYFFANHKNPVSVFHVSEPNMVHGLWTSLVSKAYYTDKLSRKLAHDAVLELIEQLEKLGYTEITQ